MLPVAQQIARLDWNFIMSPSLAVREEREAARRLKQIGARAVSSGFSSGRAYRY
jgi:hypothetical protein